MADPRIGRMIADRYQLESMLGEGGMGVVYAATHTWTERPVAVKILRSQYSAGDPLKRFFREARTAAGLRHPNVVDVLDMGEDDDGTAFIVLERLEGESLEARLKREGTLGARDALRIVLPLIEALSIAHLKGIIHRDIKPANIFLAEGHHGHEVPKLLDFGVAKLMEGSTDLRTVTGSVVGTPGYASPEQLLGTRELTPASDVWGMGVVLYRMLGGELPHEPTSNLPAWVMRIVGQPAAPLCDAAPHLSAPLTDAVMSTLVVDVADRISDMPTLLQTLLSAAAECGIDVLDPRASAPPGMY